MVKEYTLQQVAERVPGLAVMANAYACGRVRLDASALGPEPGAMRLMCLCIAVVRSGSLQGEICMKPFSMRPGDLVVLGGNAVVSVAPDGGAVEADMLAVSYKFMQDLNFDLSVIDLHDLVEKRPENVVGISPAEADTLCTLFAMLTHCAGRSTEHTFVKSIARSLLQAVIYQLLLMRASRHGRPEPLPAEGGQVPLSRQTAYVQEFMRLLQLHHMRERAIAFYADRLCISPKYLSHLVKEATGRSATDWIAECVVQEAKNMLRYSNKNVQQVAYDLNFSTQSSFGKYFKHVTGMSPTEYQKNINK